MSQTMKKLFFFPIVCLLFAACQSGKFGKTEQTAVAGTVLGAGLGAIIGHRSGKSGAGVAIGSAAGALAGGLLGNRIEANEKQIDQRELQLNRQQQEIEENRRIISELRRRGADVRGTDRGVIVNLPDVLFDYDKYSLRKDAIFNVSEIANVIKQYPERRIAVEGHTDSTGTMEYNQGLSERRAYAVADELVATGVSRRRIGAHGYGESDPIATNRTSDGRQRNRRVEVIILNK